MAWAGNPYVLLSLAILCWSGNFVVGRLANLDVPPVALSFWRHILALVLVVPFAVPALRRDWPTVREKLGIFAILSALFVAGNTAVYFAILETAIINATLLNAGVPVVAVFFSWLILSELINRWQALGIILSFAGIVTVVTRGDVAVLAGLGFGWGDLFMFLAITAWGLYMVLLKHSRIEISPWTLLLVLSVGGSVWLVPCYAIEIATGETMTWTGRAVASLLYVALFSTIIAWACWNVATLRIGPNRAASFMCLHPVFGAAWGLIFFDEALRPYHVFGTVPVLIGVILVSRAYTHSARV